MKSAHYVGRFAPSPTGPLHFGSLLAAMASYCDAHNHQGTWHLRVDDIDPPRAMPCADEQIQRTLNSYGFHWDGPVIRQSERTELYYSKLNALNDLQLLFPCDCTRSRLAGETIYPGYCNPASSANTPHDAAKLVKEKLMAGNQQYAIRIIIDKAVEFDDLIQGPQHIGTELLGDTIVVRRDDLFAYALACAVDDADGISHVVRGSDLLTSTASQIAIMESLGLQPPSYAHIPIVVNTDQQKLSKQTRAHALDSMPILPTLHKAWQLLGQHAVTATSVETFWDTAIASWNLTRVPKQSQLDTPV